MMNIHASENHTISDAEAQAVNALIIDDDKFDRAKIRRLFKVGGIPFVLSEADTLKSLKDSLDSMKFDVVLIDYNLTYGNGIDALKLIQRHPKNSDVATIMITGDDRSKIAVEALKTGCKDYLSKNQLSAHDLRATINSAIEKSGIENTDDFRWKENLENLTEVIVANYANALQPRIANILQAAKKLKQRHDDPKVNTKDELEDIEKQCMDLWLCLTDTKQLNLKH